MVASNIIEILSDFFFGGNNSIIEELSHELSLENDEDNILRKKCEESCKNDFGDQVWNKLDPLAKEHIISAQISSKTAILANSDISRSIQSITASFEDELKTKIFDDFNLEVEENIDLYYEGFDVPYIEQLKKGFVSSKMMLSKLEIVNKYNVRGISLDLKEFLMNDWYLYKIGNVIGIKQAYDLLDIRNLYSHDNTEFDKQKYEIAKSKTVAVLKWFIGSMK